jgi:hypothetical protein
MVTFFTPANKGFITTIMKVQPLTWVNQFQAFTINGIAGVFHNYELCKDLIKADIHETLCNQISE